MNDHVVRTAAIVLAALSIFAGASARAADPVAGKAVYTAQCMMCHPSQAGRNMLGPSLFGVVGRGSASVPGFRYSPANQAARLTWDEPTLDRYLQAPAMVIPGTTMTFGGVKDDTKRADLIAYLATLK